MNPGGGIDQDHGHSALATLLEEFVDADQILAGSRVPGQFSHPLTAVEFLDGSDDCFALRLCLAESHCVRKLAIWNINGGFHDSTLSIMIFSVNVMWNNDGRVLNFWVTGEPTIGGDRFSGVRSK